MAIEVRMPKFGLTMHEGTIQRFFKGPGEQVRGGEPLYEVETEKVLYEVEAPASGVLALILCEPDATVGCGEIVAVIAEDGDDLKELAARYRAPLSGQPARAEALSDGAADSPANTMSGGPRKLVSPVARKLAAELQVDLERIAGTGPGGRITREDVERAGRLKPATSTLPGAETAQSSSAATPSGVVKFRGMRKTIAERMLASLQQSAQITITTEADVTGATELRARLQSQFDFTYTDLMIQAVAHALRRHPGLNARLTDAGIELLNEINVGIAIALDGGLIVAVIRNADRKGLRQIADESRTLSERARAGHLKLEEVTGGTFTISNLGVHGVDAFTPIINPGEAAILGMGRIVEKPAAFRSQIALRAMMTLSLTFDHRLIDGAPAAEFLQTVIQGFNHADR